VRRTGGPATAGPPPAARGARSPQGRGRVVSRLRPGSRNRARARRGRSPGRQHRIRPLWDPRSRAQHRRAGLLRTSGPQSPFPVPRVCRAAPVRRRALLLRDRAHRRGPGLPPGRCPVPGVPSETRSPRPRSARPTRSAQACTDAQPVPTGSGSAPPKKNVPDTWGTTWTAPLPPLPAPPAPPPPTGPRAGPPPAYRDRPADRPGRRPAVDRTDLPVRILGKRLRGTGPTPPAGRTDPGRLVPLRTVPGQPSAREPQPDSDRPQ
jgi:hypothetical protein